MVKWRTETYSQRAASSARPPHVCLAGAKHRHGNLLLIVYMGLFVAVLALAPATVGEGYSSLPKLTQRGHGGHEWQVAHPGATRAQAFSPGVSP